MPRSSTPARWDYGRWSWLCFLSGGVLIAGHAAVRGLEAFTSITPPPDVFAPFGYLLALLGLLAYYPRFSRENVWGARLGAVLGFVLLVGWVWFAASSLGELVGVLAPGVEVVPDAVYLVHLVVMVLTYAVFGLVSTIHRVPSRAVGGLLFVPAGLILVLMTGSVLLGASPAVAFLVGGLQSVVHVAIGVGLRLARADVTAGVPRHEMAVD